MSTMKSCSIKTARNPLYGKKCAAQGCAQPMRVGDTCILIDAGLGVYVGRETHFHRRCLLAFLLDTPMEKVGVEQEIDRIRLDGSSIMALLGAE